MQEDLDTLRHISRPISINEEEASTELSITSLADCLDLHSLSISYPPLEPSLPKGREDTNSFCSKDSISSQDEEPHTPPTPQSQPSPHPEDQVREKSITMHPAYYTEWDHQYDTERLLSRSPSPPYLPGERYDRTFEDHHGSTSYAPVGRPQYQERDEAYTSSHDEETLYDPEPSDLSSIFPAPRVDFDDHGYEGLDYLEAVTSGPQNSDTDSYVDRAAVGHGDDNLLGLDYGPPQQAYRPENDVYHPESLPPSFDLLSDEPEDDHVNRCLIPGDSPGVRQHPHKQHEVNRHRPDSSFPSDGEGDYRDVHHDQHQVDRSHSHSTTHQPHGQHSPGSPRVRAPIVKPHYRHDHHHQDEDSYEHHSSDSDRSYTVTPSLSHPAPPYFATSPNLQVTTPQSGSETDFQSSLSPGYSAQHRMPDMASDDVLQSGDRLSTKRKYIDEIIEDEVIVQEDNRSGKRQCYVAPLAPLEQDEPSQRETSSPESVSDQQSRSPFRTPQSERVPQVAANRKRAISEDSDDPLPIIKKSKSTRPPAPKIILAKAIPRPKITSPKSSPTRPRNAPLGMRAAFKSAPTRTSNPIAGSSKPREIITDRGPEEFFASVNASKVVPQKQKPFKSPFGTGSKGGGIKLKPKDPNTIIERNNRASANNSNANSGIGTGTRSESGMSVAAELAVLEKEARILRQAVKYLSNPEEDDTLRNLISTWRVAGRDVVEQIFDKIPEPAAGQGDDRSQGQGGSWMTDGGGDSRFDITPEQERWLANCPKNEDGEAIDDEGNPVIPKPRDMRSVIAEACSSASTGRKDEYYPRRQYEEGAKRAAPVEEREWNIGTMMLKMSVDPTLLGWDDDAEDWFDIDTLDQ